MTDMSDRHEPERLQRQALEELFRTTSLSTFELFRTSLKDTMMKGVSLDKYVADNLIGTPDEVCEKVSAFDAAGLHGFHATLFVASTVDEMLQHIGLFARYVIPAFSCSRCVAAHLPSELVRLFVIVVVVLLQRRTVATFEKQADPR